MRRLFVRPLGACAPSQAPVFKCDASAAVANGLFGVFGGLLDYASNENTNQANRDIAWETNWANRKINEEQLAAARENWAREQANFEQQRKWAIEDRDFENAYNSPVNVRNRLLQAGINPALAMTGNAGVGSASGASTKSTQAPSFGSPPSSIPMQTGEPVHPSHLGMGISSAVQSSMDFLLRADMQEAQISAIRTQNDLNTIDTLSKVKERDWSNKQIKANIDSVLYDLAWKKKTEGERMNNLKYVNDQIQADIAHKNAMTALSEAEKAFKVDENDRAWMQLKQWIANSVSQISLNASQAHKNYQDAATSFQDELHKIFDNSKLEELYKVNKAQLDQMLIKLKYETSVQGFKDFIKTLQGFIPFGGMWN